MRALGIDLSKWDLRPLNWREARENLSFAFIKISEGIDPDPLFRAQWEAAEGYILRGLYHFFQPAVNVKSSVDKTIELASQVSPGELPPALDLEVGPQNTTLERARAWLEYYEDRTGIRPIIYSSPGFLEYIGAGAKTVGGRYINQWLREYEVWLSAWPFDKKPDAERLEKILQVLSGELDLPYPNGVPPWNIRPAFYQWTSRGEPGDIPGYYLGVGHKKAVDLNFYIGTQEDLFLRYGEPKKRPEGEEMPSPYKYSITPKSRDGLKIRLDHYVVESPVTNQIGSLGAGRYAFGNELWRSPDGLSEWLRVEMVDGSLYSGWMAVKHNGAQVGILTTLTTEGEEPPAEESSSGLEVTIRLALSPADPGEDLTGSLEVSAPGFQAQTIGVRLPRA